MITQKTQLKIEIEKKEYTFQCEPNAALSEAYQALEMLRAYIYGRIKDAEDQKAQAEKVQSEKPPEEAIPA